MIPFHSTQIVSIQHCSACFTSDYEVKSDPDDQTSSVCTSANRPRMDFKMSIRSINPSIKIPRSTRHLLLLLHCTSTNLRRTSYFTSLSLALKKKKDKHPDILLPYLCNWISFTGCLNFSILHTYLFRRAVLRSGRKGGCHWEITWKTLTIHRKQGHGVNEPFISYSQTIPEVCGKTRKGITRKWSSILVLPWTLSAKHRKIFFCSPLIMFASYAILHVRTKKVQKVQYECSINILILC